MKKWFICKHCGKEYFSYKENSNFCSNDCKVKYRNSITYKCDNCGKTFVITESKLNASKEGKHKHLFCSKDCSNKFQYKSVEKVCEECGHTYIIGNAFKDIQRFCSRDCYEKNRQRNKKLYNKVCPICNKEYITTRKEQIYCCYNCRHIADRKRLQCICDYCGKTFERIKSEVDKNKKHYCSNECRMLDRFWEKEDIEKLIRYYGKIRKDELLCMISDKWDYDAVKRKAQWLGLTKSVEWTNQETNILKQLYSTVPMSDVLIALPNRTAASILGKARSLNLLSHFYLQSKYTKDEDDFLAQNYLSMSNEELSEHLNRSTGGIAQRLYILDLHRVSDKSNYRDLNTYVRGQIQTWRNDYVRQCNYMCELTYKERDIVVHHIKSFNLLINETIDILNFPIYSNISDYSQNDLNLFVDTFLNLQDYYGEYICISEEIHKQFHIKYGYGNNTKEQWDEFVSLRYKQEKEVG